MGSHYPQGSSGVEPLDFERCVLIWGPRKISNFWGKAEAGVAIMSAVRSVCATSLQNAAGQLFIEKNGVVYNVLGAQVR